MRHPVRRADLMRVNRFQIPIMCMTMVPTFVFCCASSILILYGQRELITYINQTPNLTHTALVNTGGAYLLGLVWLFFAIVYAWARIVSGRMVGAMERIIREMDMVIQGEDRGRIKARDGDFLAGLLLPRINALIERSRSSAPAPRMWKTTEVL
ncbi:MAG: hypothetical protein H6756_09190 [Candidatus Omnitrophica bacterium]|nr:hypothetical protein [Candidatus Omnitrophota bacterium]